MRFTTLMRAVHRPTVLILRHNQIVKQRWRSGERLPKRQTGARPTIEVQLSCQKTLLYMCRMKGGLDAPATPKMPARDAVSGAGRVPYAEGVTSSPRGCGAQRSYPRKRVEKNRLGEPRRGSNSDRRQCAAAGATPSGLGMVLCGSLTQGTAALRSPNPGLEDGTPLGFKQARCASEGNGIHRQSGLSLAGASGL